MRNEATIEVLNRATDHAKIFHDHYLRARRREVFDTVDHDFARLQGPGYDQSRTYNTDLYSSIALSMNGKRGVYAAGSISKGMLANYVASQEGPFVVKLDDGSSIKASHVYDMDETVGSQNFQDIVLPQNLRMQIQKHSLFRSLFNDRSILVPSGLQGAASIAGQPEFDRGAKRRDKHYMQVWTPVIRELTDIFPVVGDWFFSGATSGLEYPEAECIAAGLRKRRPEADMWFRDWNNKDVPLSETMRHRAEYLVWATEQGNFFLKHEATAFMRSAALAEMADQGMLPRANPVFLKGILDNLGDIRALQKEIEPLILERVKAKMFRIDLTDLAGINPGFVGKALEAQNGTLTATQVKIPELVDRLDSAAITLHRYTSTELAAGDFEFREIREKLVPARYLELTKNDFSASPLRPVDMKGQAWSTYDGQSLFAQRLLPNINERERHQVSALVGGLETVMPPGNRSVFVVADDRYGPETERVRLERNLSYGDEVPNALGKDFDRLIRERHRRQVQLQPFFGRMRVEGQPLYFSTDIDDKIAHYSELPRFSMAPGEARPGPNAALLARHTVLARSTNDFCFVTGRWEESDKGVQDMVLATRMQFGLEPRSPIDPQFVRVFDEKGRYLTIADRATAIWEKLESAVSKGHDVQNLEEQASAVTQLWAFHRLARDHTLRRDVFRKLSEQHPHIQLPKDLQWERITPFMFAYDHSAFDKYWQERIKPVLEGPAVTAVRLRHLEFIEDFRAIRERQIAAQEIAIAGRPLDVSIYVRRDLETKPQT